MKSIGEKGHMTEKEIKEKLNSYRITRQDLDVAIRRVEELGEQSTATGSMAPKETSVISSPTLQAKFESLIEDKADLEQMIAEELNNLVRIRTEVEGLIWQAPTKQYRQLLTLRYIDCMDWQTIAGIMGYSEDHCYTLHREAVLTLRGQLNSS